MEADFVVLTDAVGRIHESRQRLALELRQQAMIDLSLPVLDPQDQVIAKGWTYAPASPERKNALGVTN